MTARRTCAVQMFDVALSRRMCCSRVPRASRIAGFAVDILGNTDEAAGHLALELVFRCKKAGVRSAKAHGYAEALGRADRDVGAKFAGRSQQGQCEQIRRDDGESASGVRRREESFEIMDRSAGVRVLYEHAETVCPDLVIAVVPTTTATSSGLARVRTMSIVCGWQCSEIKNSRCGPAAPSASRWHIIIASAAAVPSSSIEAFGNRESSEVGYDRLEIQQRLESALEISAW